MTVSDAARKRDSRAKERDLAIPRVVDAARRSAALDDPIAFLRTYFPEVFYQPFTDTRRQMLDAILHSARYGGDFALAGPRGDGKTRMALFGTFWLCLRGDLQFPLVISKSARRANRELKNLKDAIRDSTLLLEDFPEVAMPVVALGGWASRARMQTAFGQFTHLEWGNDVIVLPTIPTTLLRENGWTQETESSARGQIVASLGIQGPIRGFSVRNRRPDLAILDDVDDRGSAESETQTEDRVHIIEEDVGGLGGPSRTVGRLMLCTLLNLRCVAALYTDRSRKASWRGQRHRLLETKPDREDLWAEFIRLRESRSDEDPDGRVAHRFYVQHRADMDAGAVVTNPYRFDQTILPDGEPREVSALEACYAIIADRGWSHFATEYNNDPPEESGPVESGVTPQIVQRQLSGFARGVIPPGCVAITHGVDVGKWYLHWVVRAWLPDATGYTIDYGRQDVHGAKHGVDEGLDRAIRNAILRRMDEFRGAGYVSADGTSPSVEQLTLIDASYRTDAVYGACAEAGRGVYPIMGFGKSAGCASPNFSPAQQKSRNVRPGDGWKMVRRGRIWLVESDADRWKAYEHDRWVTAKDRPGCMWLFGEASKPGERMTVDELSHGQFAHQICAEVEVEEEHRGSLRRRWLPKAKENHWLDAAAYSDVAANILKVRLSGALVAKPTKHVPQHTATVAEPSAADEAPSVAAPAPRRLSLRELTQSARKRVAS